MIYIGVLYERETSGHRNGTFIRSSSYPVEARRGCKKKKKKRERRARKKKKKMHNSENHPEERKRWKEAETSSIIEVSGGGKATLGDSSIFQARIW